MDIVFNRYGNEQYLVHEGYHFIKEREFENVRTYGWKRKYCKLRLHCKDGQISCKSKASTCMLLRIDAAQFE